MIFPGIKIPWQVFACAGLVIAIWGYGKWQHHQGSSGVQAEWDAAVARGKVIVEDLKKNQGRVTTKVETVTVEKIKTIKEKGDVIVKQVKVFVPDGTCDLPGGFRLLHDAAANNTLPDASQANDAAPVPAQTAATTIAENYTTCNAAIADLEGLRSWVREQEQLYLDQCKAEPSLCSKDK